MIMTLMVQKGLTKAKLKALMIQDYCYEDALYKSQGEPP